MPLEKVLPGRRTLLALSIALVVVVVALAVVVLLIQLDLIGFDPRIPLTKEYSPYSPPGFVFNLYGGARKTGEELAKPMGISLGGDRIFVSDGAHGLIKVFDRRGNIVNSFPLRQGPPGRGNVPVSTYPVGLAVGESGRLYISDLDGSSIMVFDRDGRTLGLFPRSAESRSLLKKPLALAAAGGLLYVTDIGDQSVKIFDEKGKLVRKFGKAGRGEGEFAFPNGIAVSRDGSIFVADSNNSRVQVFSPEGKFKVLFQGDPPLSLPRGLAIDGLDRLHVTDTLAHKVAVFTLKGKFLFSYGWEEDEEETSERQLYYPNGIAIDSEGRRIYITDKGNNRVSIWEY